MKKLAVRIIRKSLAKMGLEIARIGNGSGDSTLGYIDAKATVSAAVREGLTVCDYVEKLWSQQGCTQMVIDHMASFGAFAEPNPKILEIGTGTGRYLEKVLQNCTPAKYESYETAMDWAQWLQSRYPVISREADGLTLKDTPDDSVDLVHAHGVFVYLPFLQTYRYWLEIFRVTGKGGIVVFDICDEDCFDKSTVQQWLASKLSYPSFLSRSYVVSLFAGHGFSLAGAFMNRYGEGRSEYLVFKRNH